MSKTWDDLQAIMYFQQGAGNDPKGRRLRDYRNFTDEQMESEHDFIQYMFPTDQVSKFNPNAWLLQSEPDILIMKECALPIMRSVFQYMGYLSRSNGWRTTGNHNILRISRMLRSVKLICGDDMAFDLLCLVCEFQTDVQILVCDFDVNGSGVTVLDYWFAAVLSIDVKDAHMVRRDWDWNPQSPKTMKAFLHYYTANKRKEAA